MIRLATLQSCKYIKWHRILYDNETHSVEPNKEVVFWFSMKKAKRQNVTANYWVDPGTKKKTITHTVL